MVYNSIGFNPEWAKTKTETEFIEHEKHTGLTVDQLKEAYSLMNPKPVKKAVNNKLADEKTAD